MTVRTVKDRMLLRLMAAEGDGYLTRHELGQGLSSSPSVVEDAVADLVAEGKAVHGAHLGYRLAGTELCRQAARQLVQMAPHPTGGFRRATVGRQRGPETLLGVAETCEAVAGLGVVMYELALPKPVGLDDTLAQAQAMVDFSMRGTDT